MQPIPHPIPLQHASRTDESGVGSEAQPRWVFQTAAGCHRTWLAVTEKISQSGPGNNTNNKQSASNIGSEQGNLEVHFGVLSPIAMIPLPQIETLQKFYI